eukprot:TRINITY_DN4014_c1_g2_i2.p3 TRINITY_DN4014_c1_g2~~TRINITY_DN4014_c1_g2_i2.p3  ORF type:complete len:371 (+),score=46.07 TRINITY_DN4014_c1_g2_i2:68-1114(+)
MNLQQRAVTSFQPRHTCIKYRQRPEVFNKRLQVRFSQIVSRVSELETKYRTGHGTEHWKLFAEAVSGEWDGVSVIFNSEGEPIEIPSRFVPEAFAEWGQILYDWQTQCSMIAQEDCLKFTLRKLLPTVGCEADAVAFVEEEKHILRASKSGEDKTVLRNGGFASGPPSISPDTPKFQIQQCLVTGDKKRVRFFHNFTRRDASTQWRLINIEILKEEFEQPYHGKMELGGCGGGLPKYSDKERLKKEQLMQGEWKKSRDGEGMTFGYDEGSGYYCHDEGSQEEQWSGNSLKGTVICFPQGMWSRVDVQKSYVEVESGVYLEDGSRAVARRIYQNDKMVRDSQGREELVQ